jgi:NAD(P)-dependent dehydrogenase (short-subunit alcohol dehydrogenase family)
VVIEDKNVLLAGALGSFGRAQALRLAAAGARMCLLDRPGHQNGETFAAEVTNLGGDAATFVRRESRRLIGPAGRRARPGGARLRLAKKYVEIVNFCLVTLNCVIEGYVPYVASKGALYGLTKTLVRELGGHGIRVNAVSPGAVRSEAEERVFGDRLQQYSDWVLDRQSVKERMQPEHVADLVLFLCASASDMITCQNIAIDGGW